MKIKLTLYLIELKNRMKKISNGKILLSGIKLSQIMTFNKTRRIWQLILKRNFLNEISLMKKYKTNIKQKKNRKK